MIHFVLLFNKQGNTRIAKFYGSQYSTEEKKALEKNVFKAVVARENGVANFCSVSKYTIVYHRYVSLYVCLGIDDNDNELLAHETIHNFIEILDRFFGTVRELDIIYHFSTVYLILDEIILAGYVIQTNKSVVLHRLQTMPQLTIHKTTTAS